jgi:uncharacterized membrane protein
MPDSAVEPHQLQTIAPEQLQQSRGKRMLHLALFVVGGGAAGYAYYRFIGCSSGVCPISSNPVISTIYGAFMGFMLSGGMK